MSFKYLSRFIVVTVILLFIVSCGPSIQLITPPDESRVSDKFIDFTWAPLTSQLVFESCSLQIATDASFYNASNYSSDKNNLLVDFSKLSDYRGLDGAFWRVKAFYNKRWSGWTIPFFFVYDYKNVVIPKASPIVKYTPEPTTVNIPEYLVYGNEIRLNKTKVYNVTISNDDNLAAQIFSAKSWGFGKIQFVERSSIERAVDTISNINIPRSQYRIDNKSFDRIESAEESIVWKQADQYLFADIYRDRTTWHMFFRLVNAKTGVAVLNNMVTVEDFSEPRKAIDTLLVLFKNSISSYATEPRSLLIGDVLLNGKQDPEIRELLAMNITGLKNVELLTRDFLSKSMVQALDTATKKIKNYSYYKLYDKQMSVIFPARPPTWSEGDININIEIKSKASRQPDMLLVSKGNTEQQLRQFWNQDQCIAVVSAIEIQTGKLLGIMSIAMPDDTEKSKLMEKIAELLSK